MPSYNFRSGSKDAPVELSFGQVDLHDPAHFVIRFTNESVTSETRNSDHVIRGIIEGYLNDDDSLTFKRRDDPR